MRNTLPIPLTRLLEQILTINSFGKMLTYMTTVLRRVSLLKGKIEHMHVRKYAAFQS